MPIEFRYNKGYPNNAKFQEETIQEKYKQVVEEFPDQPIIFNWVGESWSIAAPDAILHRMNVLDNETKQ